MSKFTKVELETRKKEEKAIKCSCNTYYKDELLKNLMSISMDSALFVYSDCANFIAVSEYFDGGDVLSNNLPSSYNVVVMCFGKITIYNKVDYDFIKTRVLELLDELNVCGDIKEDFKKIFKL